MFTIIRLTEIRIVLVGWHNLGVGVHYLATIFPYARHWILREI